MSIEKRANEISTVQTMFIYKLGLKILKNVSTLCPEANPVFKST